MGDFLGIGKSAAEKQLEFQREQAQAEADEARRQAEIRQAEKVAKKGQETAKIKIGVEESEKVSTPKKRRTVKPNTQVSSSLGLGGIGSTGTGVQL